MLSEVAGNEGEAGADFMRALWLDAVTAKMCLKAARSQCYPSCCAGRLPSPELSPEERIFQFFSHTVV